MRRGIKRKEKTFAFGTTQYKAKITILIPCKIGRNECFIETYVVEGNIPWLVGKESLRRMGAVLDMEKMQLWIRKYNKYMKIRNDKNGHLKVKLCERKREQCWAEEGQTTKIGEREQMKIAEKLHKQFGHPGKDKLWRTVKDTEIIDKGKKDQIKECIEKVSEDCQVCAKYKKTPSRPVAGLSMGEHFNDCVSMDLGAIAEGKTFLVIVDVVTKFSQAGWVKSKKPEEIMKTFLHKWISVFGAPRTLLTDNGGEFQNDEMLRMGERFGIEIKSTSSESPWSNGICEKVVGTTKQMVKKIREDSGADFETCLDWATNARNSLCNRNGFSAYQLVLGRNPNIRNEELENNMNNGMDGKENRILRETLQAIESSRINQIKFDNNERIKTALKANIREHHISDAQIGERVLYKREGEDSWRGPAKVIGVDGKTVIVKHGGLIREVNRIHSTRIQKIRDNQENSNEATTARTTNETESIRRRTIDNENGFSLASKNLQIIQPRTDNQDDQEKSLNEENEILDEEINQEQRQNEENNGQENGIEQDIVQNKIDCSKLKQGERIRATNKETGQQVNVEILGRAGKVGKNRKGKYMEAYNIEYIDTRERDWINFKEYDQVQKIDDEQEIWLENWKRTEIEEAKKSEIENWKENDVFEIKEDIGQKTLSCRWVITEKIKDGQKKVKARLVVRGFEEEDNSEGTDSPTCKPEILKMALCIIKMKGWKVKTLDIKTAYLQGDRIEREVFIKPPKDYRTGENVVWKLKKSVYGLKDAARMWYNKVKKVVKELGGRNTKLEPTLFKFNDKNDNLCGVIVTHVDDFCYGGNEQFLSNVIEKLKYKLKIGDEEEGEFKYIGVKIKDNKEDIIIEQKDYIKSIDEIEWSLTKGERMLDRREMKIFRGIIGQLNWVAQQSRPDVSFSVSNLSRQCKNATTRDMRRLTKVVRKTKNEEVEIRLRKITEGKEKIIVYSDAAFGNVDLYSQIGYIVSIEDEKGHRCPILWKSVKGKRVAKSTSEAEILGVGEATEAGVWLRELWNDVTGRKIPIEVRTDSNNIRKTLNSITGNLTKRMSIDVAALREMIQEKVIESVQWVPTKRQIADALTKESVDRKQIINYVSGEMIGEDLYPAIERR
jgi:hypothetical protein